MKKKKSFLSKDEIRDKIFIMDDFEKKPERISLNLDNLALKIAVENDLTKDEVKKVLKSFFREIAKNSKKYSYVMIYGLGKFREKKIKGKNREKNVLVFKSSFEI